MASACHITCAREPAGPLTPNPAPGTTTHVSRLDASRTAVIAPDKGTTRKRHDAAASLIGRRRLTPINMCTKETKTTAVTTAFSIRNATPPL